MENMMYDNWNKISIEKYYKLNEYLKKQNDDEIDFALNIYSILNDVSVEDLENENIFSIKRKLKTLDFLKDEPKPIKIKSKTVIINGIEFFIEYNIIALKTFEFLDINHYLKENDNIGQILSIILKPIESKKKNLIGKFTYEFQTIERNELIDFLNKNVDIVTANSILAFFLKVWQRQITLSKNEIIKIQNRIIWKMIWNPKKKKTLTVGLRGLTELQKQLDEIGQKFMS